MRRHLNVSRIGPNIKQKMHKLVNLTRVCYRIYKENIGPYCSSGKIYKTWKTTHLQTLRNLYENSLIGSGTGCDAHDKFKKKYNKIFGNGRNLN